MYANDLTMWMITEQHFPMVDIKELALVIAHGKMSQDPPRFTLDPDMVELNEFNVGQPKE